MNFQTMQYFIAVAEERSFTRAAERLSVTQQTLSAHIAGVERELGVRLVERRVPLQLTYAGEQFLGYARRFRAEQRAMRHEFRDIAGDESGRLRIGVTNTRGHIMMPRAIATFAREHPKIRIRLDEGENAELVEQLLEGTIDLVVATVDPRTPGLVVHDLYSEQLELLVSNALLEELYGDKAPSVIADVITTGSLASVAGCPFMVVGQRDVTGEQARRLFAESGIDPWVRVISKNSETLVALARRGVGACLVPSELVATTFPDPGAAGMSTVRFGERMSYAVSVAWRAQGHTWSMVEAFAEVLRDQFSDATW